MYIHTLTLNVNIPIHAQEFISWRQENNVKMKVDKPASPCGKIDPVCTFTGGYDSLAILRVMLCENTKAVSLYPIKEFNLA